MNGTKKSASDWRRGTNRRRIAEVCESGASKQVCLETLRPLVASGEMVFTRNPNREAGETHRMPLSLPDQIDALRHEIGRVYALLGRAKGARFESEEIPQDENETEIPQDENEDENEQTEQDENENEETENENENDKPRAKGKQRLEQEWSYFMRRVHEIRRFCWKRKRETGENVDSVGYRWAQAGAALIAAGIPADVLLVAATMHWSPDTRQDAGIDDFDFNGEGNTTPHPGMLEVSQRVMRERGIDPSGKHCLFGYLLLLVENRVPVMLIGPAGTGKSHIVKQIAKWMELEYSETPMSAGASRGDLLGRHTISKDRPFITSAFENRYTGGGIFCFEEIDRSAPEVLIPMHNALASDEMFNSVNGETLQKSTQFGAASTGNTFGLGAGKDFTTGERLDAATLDRFRMGRMFLPVDEEMEMELFTRQFHEHLS